jgi:hypothetical protein
MPPSLILQSFSGTDISFDGGKTWQPLSDKGFHVVKSSKTGNLIIAAGGNGKLSKIKL